MEVEFDPLKYHASQSREFDSLSSAGKAIKRILDPDYRANNFQEEFLTQYLNTSYGFNFQGQQSNLDQIVGYCEYKYGGYSQNEYNTTWLSEIRGTLSDMKAIRPDGYQIFQKGDSVPWFLSKYSGIRLTEFESKCLVLLEVERRCSLPLDKLMVYHHLYCEFNESLDWLLELIMIGTDGRPRLACLTRENPYINLVYESSQLEESDQRVLADRLDRVKAGYVSEWVGDYWLANVISSDQWLWRW